MWSLNVQLIWSLEFFILKNLGEKTVDTTDITKSQSRGSTKIENSVYLGGFISLILPS